jgi:hypothetical protein
MFHYFSSWNKFILEAREVSDKNKVLLKELLYINEASKLGNA